MALCFVLSIAVLVLVAIQYSNLAQWYASYREPPRSTIDIASIQTAIEYEYRFTEYRFTEYRFTEYRYTEYEYDEIRRAARTLGFRERRLSKRSNGDPHYRASLKSIVRPFQRISEPVAATTHALLCDRRPGQSHASGHRFWITLRFAISRSTAILFRSGYGIANAVITASSETWPSRSSRSFRSRSRSYLLSTHFQYSRAFYFVRPVVLGLLKSTWIRSGLLFASPRQQAA
jgi:hypothetical protein